MPATPTLTAMGTSQRSETHQCQRNGFAGQQNKGALWGNRKGRLGGVAGLHFSLNEEAVAKARGSLTRGPFHFHAKAAVPTLAVALAIRAARAIQGTAARPPRTSSHSSPSTLLVCLLRPHHRGHRFCPPQESLRTARRVQGLRDATVADFEARDSSRPTSPGPTQPSCAPMRGSPGDCSQALARGWAASLLPVLQAPARPSCEPLCWSRSGAWQPRGWQADFLEEIAAAVPSKGPFSLQCQHLPCARRSTQQCLHSLELQVDAGR
mmetsp:Transcript_121915/g.289901  ORF Transcript_121915/g.289901 Transcript_121915/m.289901 type:complete len:266 (+) Transcript_121915:85-882(+)